MIYEQDIEPRGVLTMCRRGIVDVDPELADVIDVTGVRVCKVREKFGVCDLAILYSSVTSLRGHRL
jgi:hypothetical protein